jgi:hypothetical protein
MIRTFVRAAERLAAVPGLAASSPAPALPRIAAPAAPVPRPLGFRHLVESSADTDG